MHRKKRNIKAPIVIALLLAIVILFGAGFWQALDYSPDGNPGAAGTAALLFFLAGILGAVISVIGFLTVVRAARREMTALGMTPGQQAVTEGVAMEGAHLVLSRHNREVSERLTQSVMGEPRECDLA